MYMGAPEMIFTQLVREEEGLDVEGEAVLWEQR